MKNAIDLFTLIEIFEVNILSYLEVSSANNFGFDARLYDKSLIYFKASDQDYSLKELRLQHMSMEHFDHLKQLLHFIPNFIIFF